MSPARGGPPPPWMTAGEALAPLELLRLGAQSTRLNQMPRGEGAPVLLTPGLGATDVSMTPLRQYLQRLGHQPHRAGLGRIRRDPQLARTLIDRTSALHERSGRPVALIGWSLGGILSREVAREVPHAVSQVITFGSPIVGGPRHTLFRQRYSPEQLAQIDAILEHRVQRPIEVPITAIWSRRDGVVSPRACIDEDSPVVENVEVRSTHVGMAMDPDVWSIVAKRLTRRQAIQG